MKKKAVLISLFVIPIVVYLFFASGVYNFAKLPTLTQHIDFYGNQTVFKDKITVLGFLGTVATPEKTGIFNLNEKIGKRFGDFDDFQFVFFYPDNESSTFEIENLKNEMRKYNSINKWQFIPITENDQKLIFNDLKSPFRLNPDGYSPYVFIIDKESNLRGRTDDEDLGKLYGYNTTSVAELSNKMVDDVKVILAEYRLALKKYNKDNSKTLIRKK